MLITNSSQIKTPENPRRDVTTVDESGKLRFIKFNAKISKNHNGADIALVHLPFGLVRVFGILSRISAQFEREVKISIGYRRYKIPLGAWVDACDDAFDKDLKSGEFNICSQYPLKTAVFNAQEGLEISMRVKGPVIKGDTVFGYIIYIKD